MTEEVISYGKARVYIENNGIIYLVFDGTKLEEDEKRQHLMAQYGQLDLQQKKTMIKIKATKTKKR